MSPINVPQVGSPETKLLVPSIGSRTQTYSASGRSCPYSSPITPWAGNVCPISRRIAASAPRSASVTGSNTPPRDLSSARIALRKNGRITSPETCASRSTKAAKSTAVIQKPHKRVKRHAHCAYLLSKLVIEKPCQLLAISFYIIDCFIAIGALRQECNSAPNLGGFYPQGEENTCNGGSQRRYCCGAA